MVIKDELFSLAEHYVEETSVSLFITGKAGTGKTTFLKYIVEHTSKRCIVLAPTGVAAVNARGSTIHSFFSLPLCPYLPEVRELVTEYQMPERYRRLKRDKIKIIKTLDLLIIDEVSMVRADLMDAMDMMLRRYRRSSHPFGGVQLLMIGDAQQLSPVVTDAERPYISKVYQSPYFFHSKALRYLPYKTIELRKIYRQEDAEFISILNAIRDAKPSREALERINSRVGAPTGDDWIRLVTHNNQADKINRERLDLLEGKEIYFLSKKKNALLNRKDLDPENIVSFDASIRTFSLSQA
ncbi:MAG: AAA family ATPase, partial [Oscillospiraceae bacterium]|nr:AAA family ATPase [Oscillospiraceae bacterium]